jgi:hypothetical protein
LILSEIDHRARYQSVAFSPVSRICAQVKHLGCAAAKRIRLYGEEFEVVSDPFPEADGVAVHVTTKKDPSIRLLGINSEEEYDEL